jgi:hypothetical protein
MERKIRWKVEEEASLGLKEGAKRLIFVVG